MSHYFENDNKVKSEEKIFAANICGANFNFYSDNGVFNKSGIDFGSRLLIEEFIKEYKSGKVLDVGCGIGVIGVSLSKLVNAGVDMVDVNLRALGLANKNIFLNKLTSEMNVFESNCYSSVTKSYDYIITNPPIRAGKKVVYEILLGAYNRLNDNGELWFVIRKDQGALSAKRDVEEVFGNCEVMAKDKGFFILRTKKVSL
jgi:16S rRNA (guanine1207-N2)-methyltransferase